MKHYVIKPNTNITWFDTNVQPYPENTNQKFTMQESWLFDENKTHYLFNHKHPLIDCFKVDKSGVEIQEFCDCCGIELKEGDKKCLHIITGK